ncbi:MAG: DUF624 domain-containing protein [Ruminococcaceae bacterium]|nr:DUF624 domain-containing protein [Oscillospiraceae bacterium]
MGDKAPKKKFKLFDTQREGPGVPKDERKLKYDLYSYFVRMWRNMGKLVSVNLLYVVGNFPLFFALIAMTGRFNIESTAPVSPAFPALHGVMLHSDTPAYLPLLAKFGEQTEISALGPFAIVLLCLSALVIFTFGLVNVGTAYVLRNIVSGEAVYPWSDFWYAVKRNVKQGLIFGIIDALAIFVLYYDMSYFWQTTGTLVTNIMFYTTLVCCIIYFFMRFYIYLMMVTFDLSIFKLIKNALIFSILGFGRNVLALIGILLIAYINLILFAFMPSLGLAVPIIITLALMCYTATFVAYYKIKDVMIDPYYEKLEQSEE